MVTVWPLVMTILVEGLTVTTVPSASRIWLPVSSTRITRPMTSRSVHVCTAPAERYPIGIALDRNTSLPVCTELIPTACQTRPSLVTRSIRPSCNVMIPFWRSTLATVPLASTNGCDRYNVVLGTAAGCGGPGVTTGGAMTTATPGL